MVSALAGKDSGVHVSDEWLLRTAASMTMTLPLYYCIVLLYHYHSMKHYCHVQGLVRIVMMTLKLHLMTLKLHLRRHAGDMDAMTASLGNALSGMATKKMGMVTSWVPHQLNRMRHVMLLGHQIVVVVY